MRVLKKLLLIVIVSVTALGFAASNQDASQQNIVDTAKNAAQFTTLVKAIQAAGLVNTLSGQGPYTVFAPTDAAFKKLPRGTLDNLLNDPAKLRKILTYHVVKGELNSQNIQPGKVATVEGDDIMLTVKNGHIKVNGVKVSAKMIKTSNGVIYVIDKVLIPN